MDPEEFMDFFSYQRQQIKYVLCTAGVTDYRGL